MSGKQGGEFSDSAGDRRNKGGDKKMDEHLTRPAAKGDKQRVGDVARALRTIYDDTLRESVPDDFKDLLGKLS